MRPHPAPGTWGQTLAYRDPWRNGLISGHFPVGVSEGPVLGLWLAGGRQGVCPGSGVDKPLFQGCRETRLHRVCRRGRGRMRRPVTPPPLPPSSSGSGATSPGVPGDSQTPASAQSPACSSASKAAQAVRRPGEHLHPLPTAGQGSSSAACCPGHGPEALGFEGQMSGHPRPRVRTTDPRAAPWGQWGWASPRALVAVPAEVC